LEDIPLWVQAVALGVLLAISAFFSIAETSMMALNRSRLRHLVDKGRRSARIAAELLSRTDKLLGTILLGNNLVNTAVTAIVTALAIRYFGNDDLVLAAATASVALVIIVFCEIIPKVIGATWPDRVALPASHVLAIVMRLFSPAVWMINLITGRLLGWMRVPQGGGEEAARLSPEELRTVVLESTQVMPAKHRAILTNLFDLETISVDDLMTPRGRVEALDLATSADGIRQQLTTCYHNKLPVCEGSLNKVVGILHVRRALALLSREDFDIEDLRALLTEPYFIPSGTPVFAQLQFFQDNKRRLALVVDEYGEVLGLVTLEDILELIIGEFTTSLPAGDALAWDDAQEVLVDGSVTLRELNRRLDTAFPLDGPRTLNGWLLETLQTLPDGSVGVRHGGIGVAIVQIEDRTIRSVRLRRIGAMPAPGGDPD